MLLDMFSTFQEIIQVNSRLTFYRRRGPNIYFVSRDINPLQLHVSKEDRVKSNFCHMAEVNSSFSSETSLNPK